MCGISGIVGKGWERGQLEAMVSIQRHRGPDDDGIYIDASGTVGLGHNRLSIIDLSPAGHQPMSNHDGTLWIVFNGEIYNYLELRAELSEYPYRTQSDTEVILAAYEQWGEDCAKHFVGMFAFAIWDERQQKLFCVRDRLGIKPFYYAQVGDRFMFASEIKALLEAGYSARANDGAIYDYLVHGLYDHTAETFFDGIMALEPGHTLTWDLQNITVRPYWDLTDMVLNRPEPNESPYDWRDHLEALLIDAARLHLRSDVPVGIHLTGGLDSSALLALLDDLMPNGGQIQAFTGIYGDHRYDEATFSAEVTRSLQVGLNECPIGLDQLWDVAARTQWHQEQPFGGVATLVYWNMDACARQKHITVLLEGQGGDELFGGYAYYVGNYASDLERAGQSERLARFVDKYSAAHNIQRERIWKRIRQMQSNHGAGYQDGSSYLRPDCLTETFRATDGIMSAFPQPSSSTFTNARVRDLRYTKLPRVLRFNDRMSMAFGCELRVPFLDHRLVEFSFTLPNSLLLYQGLPKWPLRAAVGTRLSDRVRFAPKRDVVTPQREWFRGALRADIQTRLAHSELARRGYVDAASVRQAFSDFCADESLVNSLFIWQWLNLDLWFEVFRPS